MILLLLPLGLSDRFSFNLLFILGKAEFEVCAGSAGGDCVPDCLSCDTDGIVLSCFLAPWNMRLYVASAGDCRLALVLLATTGVMGGIGVRSEGDVRKAFDAMLGVTG